jgi:hypothetical protein
MGSTWRRAEATWREDGTCRAEAHWEVPGGEPALGLLKAEMLNIQI